MNGEMILLLRGLTQNKAVEVKINNENHQNNQPILLLINWCLT